jgi:hypothetical protein
MEGATMMKEERKIVVAVDESKESMYALSWCLSNLVSHSSKNTLVLLYVKPPPVYSSYDAAGLQYLLLILFESHDDNSSRPIFSISMLTRRRCFWCHRVHVFQ